MLRNIVIKQMADIREDVTKVKDIDVSDFTMSEIHAIYEYAMNLYPKIISTHEWIPDRYISTNPFLFKTYIQHNRNIMNQFNEFLMLRYSIEELRGLCENYKYIRKYIISNISNFKKTPLQYRYDIVIMLLDIQPSLYKKLPLKWKRDRVFIDKILHMGGIYIQMIPVLTDDILVAALTAKIKPLTFNDAYKYGYLYDINEIINVISKLTRVVPFKINSKIEITTKDYFNLWKLKYGRIFILDNLDIIQDDIRLAPRYIQYGLFKYVKSFTKKSKQYLGETNYVMYNTLFHLHYLMNKGIDRKNAKLYMYKINQIRKLLKGDEQ